MIKLKKRDFIPFILLHVFFALLAAMVADTFIIFWCLLVLYLLIYSPFFIFDHFRNKNKYILLYTDKYSNQAKQYTTDIIKDIKTARQTAINILNTNSQITKIYIVKGSKKIETLNR